MVTALTPTQRLRPGFMGMFKRRLVGWSSKCQEIRRELGFLGDGDEAEIVSNDGFTAPYRYVGDEKYRKALVSLRRAEYRFSGFVPATSDDGTPIDGKLLPRKLD